MFFLESKPSSKLAETGIPQNLLVISVQLSLSPPCFVTSGKSPHCVPAGSHLTLLDFRSQERTLTSSAVSQPELLLSHLSSNMHCGSQSCSPGPGHALVRTLTHSSCQGLRREPEVHPLPPSLQSPSCHVVGELSRGNASEACPLLASAQRGQ